jgi:hypothetical protein
LTRKGAERMGKNLKSKELGPGLSQRKDGRYSARFVTSCGKRVGKDVRIKDTEIPYLLIRSRLEKYDYSIMEYVLKTLNENTTRVRNVKKYLLATLYNAPSTVDNYYEFDASHDSGGIRRKEYYEESD